MDGLSGVSRGGTVDARRRSGRRCGGWVVGRMMRVVGVALVGRGMTRAAMLRGTVAREALVNLIGRVGGMRRMMRWR